MDFNTITFGSPGGVWRGDHHVIDTDFNGTERSVGKGDGDCALGDLLLKVVPKTGVLAAINKMLLAGKERDNNRHGGWTGKAVGGGGWGNWEGDGLGPACYQTVASRVLLRVLEVTSKLSVVVMVGIKWRDDGKGEDGGLCELNTDLWGGDEAVALMSDGGVWRHDLWEDLGLGVACDVVQGRCWGDNRR